MPTRRGASPRSRQALLGSMSPGSQHRPRILRWPDCPPRGTHDAAISRPAAPPPRDGPGSSHQEVRHDTTHVRRLALTGLTACDDPTEPAAVAAPVTAPARASAVDQQFNIRFLPRGFALPFAINEQAEVVGIKEYPTGVIHAGSWRARQGVRDLGTLGGASSQAIDINDRGDVVGGSEVTSGSFEQRTFLWTEARGMRSLGTFGGELSGAFAINNRREVVGGSQRRDGGGAVYVSNNGNLAGVGEVLRIVL
jgi:probable HAF family extracellular repeat protein